MREKLENMPLLVFLLLGAVLAGYYYMLSLDTNERMQNQISQLTTQLQEKKESYSNVQNSSAETPMMKDEISKITESLAKARDLIPATASTRDVVAIVTEEAKNAGVRVTASRPSDKAGGNENYDELSMDVEFEGSFSQLTLFMYQISKRKLILHPTDMDLTSKEVIDRQANLKMSGKIVGFKFKEAKSK